MIGDAETVFDCRSPRQACKRIAILVENGFERVEFTDPRKALDEAGAETQIVSPVESKVKAWEFTDWGEDYPVDVPLAQVKVQNFDALLLPGGVLNPDTLRTNQQAIAFVKDFFQAGKPVASICHGPWTLIEAAVVNGRQMTSWPPLRIDLQNAGAKWVDQEVVVDQGLVTSRSPDDLPAFIREMIKLFSRAREQARKTT